MNASIDLPITSAPARNSMKCVSLRRALLVILLLLACFGLSSTARAVLPAPDGGYGGNNTAEGTQALQSLTAGVWNTAIGYRALFTDTTASKSTALGYDALYSNNGQNNTAIGARALFSNSTGSNNIAIGSNALLYNTTGSNNILIGNLYGAPGFGHVTTQSGLTIIGNTFYAAPQFVNIGGVMADYKTDYRVPQVFIKAVNNIGIGAYDGLAGDEQTNGVSVGGYYVTINGNTVFIHGLLYATAIYGNPIAGSPVVVNSQGLLGVPTSSSRFKDEIKPMESTSEVILALKPVTFRYKKQVDPKGTAQFGLVAEEVEKANPDLVTRDADGKPYTVRYEAVNAMLLNEFLKEHRKVERQECKIREQGATIAQLKATVAQQQKDFIATAAQQQKQIEVLTAGLQKVSAQIETGRLAPEMALNNP